MSSFGDRKAAVKKLKNLIFTPKTEVKDYRVQMDNTFGSVFVPNRVEASERNIGGVLCDVLNPEVYNSRRVMIYIHGGCFVGGSRSSYRPFAAALANAVSCRAFVPEFRLAPTHPYPASLEDVRSVFRTIYTEELVSRSLDGSSGDNAKPEILVMADGSGASIALGLILGLEERFLRSIRQVFLFSPWLDVSKDSKIISAKKASDNVLSAESLRRAAELYTFQDNRELSTVSPLKASASELQRIPPVYIQMGENELLLEDAKLFAEKLKAAGVECTLDVWPKMENMFQLADEYLEESHLAIEKIGKTITARKLETEEDIRLFRADNNLNEE